LLLVFSEKQQAKAKRSESKKRKQLQSRAKIAEVRVENRCVTPKGATHPFGFWHTSFRQACSGPACLPRATERSVQSGGGKLAGAAGAQAAVPAKEAAAGAPGVLAEGPAGAAQAGRSSPAHLPPGIAVQRRLRAGGRGMPTGNENERPALSPETRTQNKCSWKKRVDRQAREMFAEVSRYTPASKNQKRQACKSRLERSALRTGLLNPHNSLPAAQTATKPSNSTLSWRWRAPHAGVTLHGHPPGPFESL